MWTTFLGKHIKPSSAEIVLALIPSWICNNRFRNRLDSLTLCNTRTVTFKLVAVKRRCSWFTQLYICASYLYSLLLCIYSSVVICYYLVSYFIHCSIILFHFHLSFVDCWSKEKEQFWTWTLFRYFDPVKQKKYLLLLQVPVV